MPGPPPKPTVIKLITGNPGRKPLPVNEPKPRRGIPAMPGHLKAEARREWARMADELAAVGLLTVVDRAALAAYCQSYADWVRAEGELRRHGMVTKGATKRVTRKKHGTGDIETEETGGTLGVSPWVKIRDNALRQMHRFLAEFGMTPASRSRIQAGNVPPPPPSDREEDEADRFFTRNA